MPLYTPLLQAYNARMSHLRVLYDGWPLLYAPLSAAAWHLRTLLALAPETENLLAVPEAIPGDDLPQGVQVIEAKARDRGAWEQRTLTDLAERNDANCIHTTGAAASLLGKTPTIVSPSEVEGESSRGRLAEAQGRGGLARAQILWPSDADKSDLHGKITTLPPVVHPAFTQRALRPSHLDLPEEYLLYHGAGNERTLLNLLESWTWAAASIGELYPLLLTGLSASAQVFVEKRLPDFHLQDFVRVLAIQAGDLPGLLQHCAAFVYPETPAAWGNPLRHALACGKAVVAHQDSLTENIMDSAAYLVDAANLRSFGAATIAVVVDEKVRESLEAQAKQKSARWSADAFKLELSKIYAQFA